MTSTHPANPRPVRRQRRQAFLLVASLCLNLFGVGWWLTVESTGTLLCPNAPQPHPAPQVVAERIAAALPKADGERLRRIVAERHDRMSQSHAAYMDAFTRLRNIVGSDPFDESAMRATLKDLRERHQEERQILGEAITDSLVEMSLEGRRAFVNTRMGGSAKPSAARNP